MRHRIFAACIVLAIACVAACGNSSGVSTAEQRWRDGNAALERRDFPAAIGAYNAAIQADPNFALAYMSRGNAEFGAGDYDAAAADYTAAIERNPQLPEAYLARGTLHWSLGELDQAQADYQTLTSHWPDNSFYASQYGSVLRENGDSQAAEDFFRSTYMADRSRDWALLNWIAFVELNHGADAALQETSRLYDSGDHSLYVRYSMGDVYFKQQRYYEAIPQLASLRDDDPLKVPPDAFLNLASAYAATYQPTACAEAFHDYLQRLNRAATFNSDQAYQQCSQGASP